MPRHRRPPPIGRVPRHRPRGTPGSARPGPADDPRAGLRPGRPSAQRLAAATVGRHLAVVPQDIGDIEEPVTGWVGVCRNDQPPEGAPHMHRHPNATLTPRGRARVFEAVEAGMTVSAACLGAGISRRCYYRWLPRWRAQGRAGLVERVSRPHHSPRASLARAGRSASSLCGCCSAGDPTASRPSWDCRPRAVTACCAAGAWCTPRQPPRRSCATSTSIPET